MDSLLGLNRRNLVKLGIASAAVPFSEILTSSALAQDLGSEAGAMGKVGGRSESELFLGHGMPGGITESGLANLRQRAEAVGGDFTMNDAAGGGTVLRWSAPLL